MLKVKPQQTALTLRTSLIQRVSQKQVENHPEAVLRGQFGPRFHSCEPLALVKAEKSSYLTPSESSDLFIYLAFIL